MANDAKRYFDKVDQRGPDECWPWLASRSFYGVCQVRWGGTTTRSAYVALELAGTPRLPGHLVRNTCGVDSCVNPRHLEQYVPPSAAERFASMVGPATPAGCTEWTGYRNKCGYGLFRSGQGPSSVRSAHRFAYEQAHGPIPDGMIIMHSCDNPACVNSDHLSAGSPSENMADRNQKGRQARGVTHHSSKLIDRDIRVIRQLFAARMRVNDIARLFSVSPATVSHIKTNRTWRHVV